MPSTRRLATQLDNRMLLDFDYRMHLLIWQCAHNEFLEETLDRLYSHGLRLWNYAVDRAPHLDIAMCEHLAIVAAIQANDARSRGWFGHGYN